MGGARGGAGPAAASRPRGGVRCARDRPGAAALDTLVAPILLQRDAGGDLSALLRDLAAALEERGHVLADARSATELARFMALLVSGLPAAGPALGEIVQPGFVAKLASEPLSAVMVLLVLVLQVVAFVCVARIARVGALP